MPEHPEHPPEQLVKHPPVQVDVQLEHPVHPLHPIEHPAPHPVPVHPSPAQELTHECGH